MHDTLSTEMDPFSPLSEKQKCLWFSVLPHYIACFWWKAWLFFVNRFFQTVHLNDSAFLFFLFSCIINGKYCNFICQFIAVINRGIWVEDGSCWLTRSLETGLVGQRRFSVHRVHSLSCWLEYRSERFMNEYSPVLSNWFDSDNENSSEFKHSSWPQDKSWRKCIEIVGWIISL